MRIAVVIVTYNSADVLAGCLRSLEHQRGVEIVSVVVADNASRDDSLAVAKDADLPVIPLAVGRNGGFAAGINAGVAAVDAAYDAVMVLNPDCRLRPDTLARLAATLQRASCGIAVPKLLNSDGSFQPSLRYAPTLRRAFGEAFLGRAASRLPGFGELITDPRERDLPGAYAWATGAAMLISASTLREVGPWDESFLLYSEETDFALRAADHGWTLWYEPSAEITHIGGEQQVNPTLNALSVVNKVKLYRRRHSALAGGAYFLIVLAGEAMRAALGRRRAWAAVVALVRPSRRLRALAT
ncbi:MAG: glycosyltransferase family 2 protein [Hamadaea sp.]|uniref:glycosyltransferase family 2 protein n=1 Tax=Hamadaea sp. TaxID=2024425 RepID=UPI0018006E11|nr:glycosyltransferase family 2 protein [Hamadaea sp.]NUR70159.1 glycosyltransferase family 2 protein [Hamadaea sp.]NUT23527.1 glycosyltransferase family 2 protein [Hamadaea sp.]